MNPIVTGVLQSKTIWAAAALAALSAISPELPAFLAFAGLNAHTVQVVGMGSALLMTALRAVTTQSLTDKGSERSPVQPPKATP